MTEEFGWPPDAWRHMPWVTFKAWCKRARARSIERFNADRRRQWNQSKG